MYLLGIFVLHCISFALTASVSQRNYDPARDNQYHLFTRQNPSVSQPLVLGLPTILAASNYDASRKTVVTHHGRSESIVGTSNLILIPAFLAGADVNVIGVDWSPGSSSITEELLDNTHRSGQHVAQFIRWLSATTGQAEEDFILVGFSIGAHQSGITARYLNGRASYVIALDPPSYPDYEYAFTADVGRYTEIIYTSITDSRGLHHFAQNVFFPNGGSNMPGCAGQSGCNHRMANTYLAESMATGGFTARECESINDARAGTCQLSGTLQMGGWQPKAGTIGSGLYYLTTNAESPFSQS